MLVPSVAVMPAVVETARKPSPLAQVGQPRAKADHEPPPDIERLEQHLLDAVHRLPDRQCHTHFSRLRCHTRSLLRLLMSPIFP